MKEIRYSHLKSERLKRTRGVSFEDIISAELIGVKRHPKREGQNIMLFLDIKDIFGLFHMLRKRIIFF